MHKIFALKQLGEKIREKEEREYVGFKDLENTYDRANRGAL